MIIFLKTQKDIAIMDEANIIVHNILQNAKQQCIPGISTFEIDKIMENDINNYKATSAFKGYRDYPNVSCISINDTIVHGIPSKTEILKDGDLVSIDFGIYFKGFAGDSAISFVVGKSNQKTEDLIKHTKQALMAGINAMQLGNTLYDIAQSIDDVSKKYKYGNIKGFSGHGIGTKMHESPSVFNYIDKNETNIKLREGLVLALEPMFTLGSDQFYITKDKWSVKTTDGSLAAHCELSVAITKNGPHILGNHDYN